MTRRTLASAPAPATKLSSSRCCSQQILSAKQQDISTSTNQEGTTAVLTEATSSPLACSATETLMEGPAKLIAAHRPDAATTPEEEELPPSKQQFHPPKPNKDKKDDTESPSCSSRFFPSGKNRKKKSKTLNSSGNGDARQSLLPPSSAQQLPLMDHSSTHSTITMEEFVQKSSRVPAFWGSAWHHVKQAAALASANHHHRDGGPESSNTGGDGRSRTNNTTSSSINGHKTKHNKKKRRRRGSGSAKSSHDDSFPQPQGGDGDDPPNYVPMATSNDMYDDREEADAEKETVRLIQEQNEMMQSAQESWEHQHKSLQAQLAEQTKFVQALERKQHESNSLATARLERLQKLHDEWLSAQMRLQEATQSQSETQQTVLQLSEAIANLQLANGKLHQQLQTATNSSHEQALQRQEALQKEFDCLQHQIKHHHKQNRSTTTAHTKNCNKDNTTTSSSWLTPAASSKTRLLSSETITPLGASTNKVNILWEFRHPQQSHQSMTHTYAMEGSMSRHPHQSHPSMTHTYAMEGSMFSSPDEILAPPTPP